MKAFHVSLPSQCISSWLLVIILDDARSFHYLCNDDDEDVVYTGLYQNMPFNVLVLSVTHYDKSIN